MYGCEAERIREAAVHDLDGTVDREQSDDGLTTVFILFLEVCNNQVIGLVGNGNAVFGGAKELGGSIFFKVCRECDSREELEIVGMSNFKSAFESVKEGFGVIRVFALDELQVGVDEDGPQELVQLVLSVYQLVTVFLPRITDWSKLTL